MMVARITLRDGYELRIALGQNGDGMVTLLEIAKNRGRFGLGYKPTNTDKRRTTLERKEKCLACLQGHEPRIERSLSAALAKASGVRD